jgi:undecaprenyl diphosphate synthase
MSSQPAPRATTADDGRRLPVHVAIIMDGNRRWARERGRPAVFGHQQGAGAVRAVLETVRDLGIRYVTLYAFSTENWNRSQAEIDDLMNLLRFYLRRELKTMVENNVRLRFLGDLANFESDIRELIDEARAATAANTGAIVTFALNYGSRQEITRVVQELAASAAAGDLDPAEITPELIGLRLAGDVPDPDLLIRTSGEQRLSNFLLWELAYTEFVFSPVAWPDFDHAHFRAALDEYARRERRYGASGG